MAADFSQTLDALTAGLNQLHVGAQLYISRHGQPLLDHAIGEARPGVAMARDTLMIWMSSSKPLTAALILKLWQDGKLDLDDPIAKHLPAFAEHGKERVTIRHALTHTGGFRGVASRMDALPWDDAVRMICQQRLEPHWTPGRKAGYHIASSWYILGEIVQRLGGRPLSQQLRESIFEPLGMTDTWLGMPADQYDAYGDRIGVMHQLHEHHLRPHPSLDSRDATTATRPGSNARGPIRELGRFYEMLLSGGGGILSPQAVEAMTAHHRVGMVDQTFRLHLDWGLGVIVNSPHEDYQKFTYGFGPHASMRAFGHGGNQSSLGMADPEHGLVVAVVFNGMPGEAAHAQRMRSLMKAVYEDLGLT